MGRKARRRAEERESKRPHGLTPDEEKTKDGHDRCPRCGSTHLVTMERPIGGPPTQYGDVVCVDCNWQGRLGVGY